jgi:putative flippase GtrA
MAATTTTSKLFDIQEALYIGKKALLGLDHEEESSSTSAGSTDGTFENSSSSSTTSREDRLGSDNDDIVDLEQNNIIHSNITNRTSSDADHHPLLVREIAVKKTKSGGKSKTNKSSSSWLRRCVHAVQDVRVPGRRSDNVYLVQGLDRMLFSAVPPAASEVIRITGLQPPRYLWYMLSGAICDILQISTLFLLHEYVVNDGTACWAIGFVLSIPCRHTSHRYLVFGDYVGGYRKSLLRMYMGYSVIIILSTLFNLIMSHLFHLPMSVLWIVTLLWTGIANYFILKYFWSYGSSSSSTATAAGATNNVAVVVVSPGGGGCASSAGSGGITTKPTEPSSLNNNNNAAL